MKPLHITRPAKLKAHINLPASKSISNRALIINALSQSAYTPENISECDDTHVMVEALTKRPSTIDIMAAGTAMRFLSAYLSATPGCDHTITGTQRMQQRPIGILVDALHQLGADVTYAGKEGFPPLHIRGKQLAGGRIALPGNVSSQYISALLMIGPTLQQGLTLELTGQIVSRPYIDMTLHIMREFGAKADWQTDSTIGVAPQPYAPTPYRIENDWSAASYWYEMVALSSDPDARVTLPALFSESLQGDSAVQEIFAPLGVETQHTRTHTGEEAVVLRKSATCVERLEMDLVCQPDLAQTVVVTCAMKGIPFRLTGLQSLRIKETDRMTALRVELAKLGFDIREAEDRILSWDGTRVTPQAHPCIDTYEDHRMAMAFAPCCLCTDGITVNNPHVVSKSYPLYWENLRAAGFGVE